MKAQYNPVWVVDNLNEKMNKIDKSSFKEDSFSPIGLHIIKTKYCNKNESPADCFARVAVSFAENEKHAQRLFEYMAKQVFIPSTPMFANAGLVSKGMPVSCFINEIYNDPKAAADVVREIICINDAGGGIGVYLGNVSGLNLLGYMKMLEASVNAFSSATRRGGLAVYLPLDHEAIKMFVSMRKPTGGDPREKCLDLHHGVIVSKDFQHAVKNDLNWNLKRIDGQIVETIRARALWEQILATRMETGEPYMFFKDKVEASTPAHHRIHKELLPKLSNLCTEITLPTGKDHLGKERTAICLLSSLNARDFKFWKNNTEFFDDIGLFFKNVGLYFIQYAPDALKNAVYSHSRECSIGLGLQGSHSANQEAMNEPGSMEYQSLEIDMLKNMQEQMRRVSRDLAEKFGPCPDALDAGVMERFSYTTAIAPNATTSYIADNSPGIEMHMNNSYIVKSGFGSHVLQNTQLENVLNQYKMNNTAVWDSIRNNKGSVKHLSLPQKIKNVFATAFETCQMTIIDQAEARAPYIDQGQSLNLYFEAGVSKIELNRAHLKIAESEKIKTLYYNRSANSFRAENFSQEQKACESCEN